ncbi:MAG: F0F1 ATP synthase subunit B [Pseudomonadota bacterium]|jgi:F-type H+-transporting ATPase subunit b|uniref:ATP synthase subunit b n=2 Tax=Methylophaga TaxID=40222 RepID=F5SYV8_9GAMM|nr:MULTISPECIES: F0F1 ATP synthase subunit B [Methylophaga]MEC9413817.1 F0F1 ATP synthase subunit B [Pseudomonadota bacterium]EGL54279.1 F0F1-type ATP synthase, subunit b [Methylophaga aminisulfidivorans MP]WVI85473.1 F0F1 ATP synthase subunit B [Methylophaga thalassica]GLQ00656.1 ATP synthase subunit b [Methylophaga thalassica]HIC47453.1 F0F1 ATP synthase subunit B [Methylophaga sp.]
MNINATIIGQMIAFAIFIAFCMKYVWPPIMQALEERKKKIADGLAAAERGRHEQELAEKRAQQVIHEAKEQANEIVAQATKRGNQIVDESKDNARVEGERILTAAKAEIEQEANRARDELKSQVGSIALAGASKIVGREIDEKAHTDLLDELVSQI